MEQTQMKEKPVLGLLLSMALPMVISMMVNSLYNIVDSFFVAKISESDDGSVARLPASEPCERIDDRIWSRNQCGDCILPWSERF